MKIYLDNCCFNRPFDDLSQERINMEADAILSIISRCERGVWSLAASTIIDIEINKISSDDKLKKVCSLYSIASEKLLVNDTIAQLAAQFQQVGIKLYDSFHLALAEAYNYDVLLTTDDAFLNNAKKLSLNISVENPVAWLMEVLRNER
ncbi:MAG: PIN domain-containing protein [Oscillospiraceae bacterium]|nr:PIN domain-containing protein [Oscillospiraceae bacterium]